MTGQLWVEKYRPKNLEDFRGKSKTVEKALDWVKNWENRKSKAVLLHGPPGSGKTAVAEIIADKLGLELYETNASKTRTKKALKAELEKAVQQKSFTGRKKLILIDEVDGMTRNDRGGKSELTRIIDKSRFPIIMTANDAYDTSKGIRNRSKMLEIGKAHTNSISSRLREIAEKEGLEYDKKAIKSLARQSDGDMRSAINDLQSLAERYDRIDRETVKQIGYRDTDKGIFEALKIVFKTTTAATAADALDNVDEDPDTIFEWIRENVPKEYREIKDLADAMDKLSIADLFNGRIRRSQNWSLLKYVYDLMTVGVALSKQEKYKGFTRYSYPSKIKMMGRSKASRKKREEIGQKVGEKLHTSVSTATDMLPFLGQLFKKKAWKTSIVRDLELTEKETEFIEEF
ncbi:MAG: replication factor C large subunit [Candidatus Nanohaloarchaea archaeon]|nr:replication factor C large subunit [Candidatus Nanohaloarchaea archaeon]